MVYLHLLYRNPDISTRKQAMSAHSFCALLAKTLYSCFMVNIQDCHQGLRLRHAIQYCTSNYAMCVQHVVYMKAV